MNVTLTANGYQGQKAEVVEIREAGALVSIFRKGVDLAARVIYFTWDAIKGGTRTMEAETVEAPGDRTWGTWKTHGHATEGFYYGSTRNKPWPVGVRVVVRDNTAGSGSVIASKDGANFPGWEQGSISHGVAGRFYFAPVA